MKELTRRFEVITTYDNTKSMLRLRIQPLHRYSDSEDGLIDGAIFALSRGTNPEALLLFECRIAQEGKLACHDTLVRFTAATEGKLDGKPVWKPQSPPLPYPARHDPLTRRAQASPHKAAGSGSVP